MYLHDQHSKPDTPVEIAAAAQVSGTIGPLRQRSLLALHLDAWDGGNMTFRGGTSEETCAPIADPDTGAAYTVPDVSSLVDENLGVHIPLRPELFAGCDVVQVEAASAVSTKVTVTPITRELA